MCSFILLFFLCFISTFLYLSAYSLFSFCILSFLYLYRLGLFIFFSLFDLWFISLCLVLFVIFSLTILFNILLFYALFLLVSLLYLVVGCLKPFLSFLSVFLFTFLWVQIGRTPAVSSSLFLSCCGLLKWQQNQKLWNWNISFLKNRFVLPSYTVTNQRKCRFL